MVKNTCSWGLGQPTNTWLLPTAWQSVLQFYPTRQLTWEFMFSALVFLGTYAMGHAFSCIQLSIWIEPSPHGLKFTVDSTKRILSEKQEAVHWLNKAIALETHINTDVWIIKSQQKKMEEYSFVLKSKNIFPIWSTLFHSILMNSNVGQFVGKQKICNFKHQATTIAKNF